MNNRPKKEYISVLKERYKNGNKKEKTYLLDLLSDQAKVHRKYAMRVLNGFKHMPKSRRGRKPIYSVECVYHLKKLFKAMNYSCSIKMKAAMPDWLKFYQDENLTEEVRSQLLQMSSATIERLLRGHKAKLRRHLNTGTKFSTVLKNKIPIRSFDYNITEPGHIEADTVAHCGNTLLGSFVWSLTFTDIYSGWTENRAVWNKGAEGVMKAIADIERGMLFNFKSFHCDNGSEFLATPLYDYFIRDRNVKINWTRSRPRRSNDNCHVEQKNWTHVRETFGYERYGRPEYVLDMNSIYMSEQYLLYNFFIPTMKLKNKTRIGSKYKRQYSLPQTPYQRLMESGSVTVEQKAKLKKIYDSLNPFLLKDDLRKKLNQLHEKLTEDKPSVKTNKVAS
jgi:hypothetical protein